MTSAYKEVDSMRCASVANVIKVILHRVEPVLALSDVFNNWTKDQVVVSIVPVFEQQGLAVWF